MSNGRMAGNSPSMSGLRQDYHYSALQLQLTLLEQSIGGRWESITGDFGNEPIITFTAATFIDPLPQLDAPSVLRSPMTTRKRESDEGLDLSSITHYPAVLPGEILPTQVKPKAHKPDSIRLFEPRLADHTSPRRRYASPRKIR
jgi:hypothetical protein